MRSEFSPRSKNESIRKVFKEICEREVADAVSIRVPHCEVWFRVLICRGRRDKVAATPAPPSPRPSARFQASSDWSVLRIIYRPSHIALRSIRQRRRVSNSTCHTGNFNISRSRPEAKQPPFTAPNDAEMASNISADLIWEVTRTPIPSLPQILPKTDGGQANITPPSSRGSSLAAYSSRATRSI
jgi:hypothetical protein